MESNIIAQTKKLAREGSEKSLLEAENILLRYLEQYPQDTQAWLLLTRIEWNTPLEDPERIIEYANNVLTYDSLNYYALLFLAQTYQTFLGGISDEVFAQLCSFENDDFEVMAMIELAKSRYFKHRDTKKYQNTLEQSVKYSYNQGLNCKGLGLLCYQEGNFERARTLIAQALKNVKTVDARWDESSIDYWCDYYYKGTQITQWQYDDLLNILKQLDQLCDKKK
jgi:tetratricopeptide (TPR) repeat protein